jgi:hypothetical protein
MSNIPSTQCTMRCVHQPLRSLIHKYYYLCHCPCTDSRLNVKLSTKYTNRWHLPSLFLPLTWRCTDSRLNLNVKLLINILNRSHLLSLLPLMHTTLQLWISPDRGLGISAQASWQSRVAAPDCGALLTTTPRQATTSRGSCSTLHIAGIRQKLLVVL